MATLTVVAPLSRAYERTRGMPSAGESGSDRARRRRMNGQNEPGWQLEVALAACACHRPDTIGIVGRHRRVIFPYFVLGEARDRPDGSICHSDAFPTDET